MLIALFPGASAQEQAPAQETTSQTQQPAPPQSVQAPAQPPAQAAPAKLSQSDAELVVELIRTTLVALHQANLTGNYTVLRDLAAPGFREKNTAADLALIFAPIRQQKIDLGPAVFLDPQLSQAGLNNQGMLHFVGRLATRPVPVNFELLFQNVNGVWQLFGISVGPVQQSVSVPPPVPAPQAGTVKQPPASPPKRNPSRIPAKRPSGAKPPPAQQ